jgi:hypothetical protein
MSRLGLGIGLYVPVTALVLVDLALDGAPAAGVAGSANVVGLTAGSTLTLTNTVGGVYSLAGTVLSWTSAVASGTDHPVLRETLGSASNSPHDTTLSVVIPGGSGGALDFTDPAGTGDGLATGVI